MVDFILYYPFGYKKNSAWRIFEQRQKESRAAGILMLTPLVELRATSSGDKRCLIN